MPSSNNVIIKLLPERIVAVHGGLVPLAAQLVEHGGLLRRHQVEDLPQVGQLLVQVHRVLLQQQRDLQHAAPSGAERISLWAFALQIFPKQKKARKRNKENKLTTVIHEPKCIRPHIMEIMF